MKLICTQENLKRAVQSVERVTTKNSTLPILENILLEAKNGMLTLSATNLEIGVRMAVGARVEEEGTVALPVRMVSDFVSNLPAGSQVTLGAGENNILDIAADGFKAKIKGLDAQDFPIIPQSKNEQALSIVFEKGAFSDALSDALVSVSHQAARIEFTGVCFYLAENKVTLVSTDSFRLTEVELASKIVAGALAPEQTLIIPAATLREVLRLMGQEGAGEVKMKVEDGQVFFFVGEDLFLVSRLIQGKFPDYKQIIPPESQTKVLLPKDEVSRSMKLAGIFSRDKVGEVTMEIVPAENGVRFASESLQVGENSSFVQGVVSGENLKVTLNPRFLLDMIGCNTFSHISLGLNAVSAPVVVRMANEKGEAQEGYLYVVMPIRK